MALRIYQKKVLFIIPIIVVFTLILLVVLLIGDHRFFLLINQGIANPLLDLICVYAFIPLFLSLVFTPLIMIFLPNLSKESRETGVIALFSGFFSYFIGSLIKLLIMRPRPFNILSVRVLGFWHTATYSFPSTTTMLAFGISLPILIKKPRYGYFLMLLSFILSFSVIYIGYHFPGDVVGGAFLSLTFALCIEIIKKRIYALWESLSRRLKKSLSKRP